MSPPMVKVKVAGNSDRVGPATKGNAICHLRRLESSRSQHLPLTLLHRRFISICLSRSTFTAQSPSTLSPPLTKTTIIIISRRRSPSNELHRHRIPSKSLRLESTQSRTS
ncbi:hypothetical protein F0562_002992 [Nyssa sinensis]|uniref:Uncharacterized protein n=1 Tax=Nyssa sinensis TaxID=561372 RepID=A0A5J5BTL8_9ASTE|nr:hypothetical protein F0562_002992 [Nyssa sinensis]